MISIMLKSLIMQLQAMPGGKESSLAANMFLFHQGDEVKSLFLVLEGEIRLVRHQTDGHSITLQRAHDGEVLAEASLFSSHYHCHAVAHQATRMHALPKTAVLAALRTDPAFAQNWAAYLARAVQQARLRSELLSLKTVTARLDAWLSWQGSELPPKGEWKTLAEQLAVSPEALYREIAQRKSA
jgi:CRP-like cAMP-binding protein